MSHVDLLRLKYSSTNINTVNHISMRNDAEQFYICVIFGTPQAHTKNLYYNEETYENKANESLL